jgi:branched-chain amino acid transport system ATP-binding protein
MLEIKNITVYYGKSVAVQDVSLEVPEGTIVSIIGANGAGKSTVLRALTGLVPINYGEIYFHGENISRKKTLDIVKQGISLATEGRQLFPYLTVLNNLKLGATLRKNRDEINASLEEVYKLFPRLKERTNQKAGTLSGGEQQMLAIGRALMANPRLLCMDEPSLGLAPIVVEQLGEVIKDINEEGVSVLLAEQNVHLALEVASQSYVLQVGKVVLKGDTATLKDSDIVKKAYLGE